MERDRTRRRRTRRGRGPLTHVQDVLGGLMDRLDMPDDIEARGRVFLVWDDVVGEAALHARPFRFRGSVLIVEVAASAWFTELSMRKTDILKRLEREVGTGVISDIRFEMKKKRKED